MFRIEKQGDNHLHIELDGQMDSEQMEVALNEFILLAQGIEQGTMLYEIVAFHMPSFSAIGIKISKLPTLFSLVGKFRKAAVLTDEKWLQKVSEIEGLLIPGLDIKAFPLAEKAVAEAWLAAES
ncbi:STAS/SEC14 domain-containing protein [Marinomonas aquiplantarum]|uniref:SpoIIAA-like protein n=1 Tax=Marinomonas aquiplantarum TaxID=491951 RepID=A0A366CYS1_9GAMM|nr:STAS/SEC14 domain-containing protein [Marinomonas aquiplantarum]RBO82359.1 SpoIIAA-like protein [Marinomonas aquiplantarum]